MSSPVLTNPKTKTIYLVGDVTPRMATLFRKRLASMVGRGKVTVEINSEGGCVHSGLAIADSIRGCPVQVTTVVTGVAMSMGAIILAAGRERKALKSATVMVHDGWSALADVQGREHELRTEFSEACRVQELAWTRLAEYTGRTSKDWKTLCGNRNLYLTAEDAKTYNIVDEVL